MQDDTAQNWHPIPRHKQVLNQLIIRRGALILSVGLFVIGVVFHRINWWSFLLPIGVLIIWLIWSFHVSKQFTDPDTGLVYWTDEYGYTDKGITYGTGYDIYQAIQTENSIIDALNSATDIPGIIRSEDDIEVWRIPHTNKVKISYPKNPAITDCLSTLFYRTNNAGWPLVDYEINEHEDMLCMICTLH